MTVWILWQVEPHDPDFLIAIYESEESAEKERYKKHSVPAEYDDRYRIEEYGVQK